MGDPWVLPAGLELRTARPADLEQIKQLLIDRGEPADGRDLELMVTDPESGWELCAVVVDGDRVVSTASLMDEQVHLGGLILPAGQVELVATAVGYEGRGLVRALMAWAHQRSAARGHLLQVMIGIPYFYRRFGYEYSIDIPPARALLDHAPGAPGAGSIRMAGPDDVVALQGLQDQAQAGFEMTVPHSPPRRRWLLDHDSSRTYLLERDGAAVATGRVQADEDSVLLAEPAAVDEAAANALLDHVLARHPAGSVNIVHRAGTMTGRAWDHRLGPAGSAASQYYLRLADPALVLDALRPLLFRRLQDFGGEPVPELVISTFGAHYRMTIGPDGLGPVRTGGPMQAPYSANGCGVAPDQLGALLFGPLGLAGLARRRPDVYPGPPPGRFEALFPPLTADLLTFYLPY